jgi:hypothetical protein
MGRLVAGLAVLGLLVGGACGGDGGGSRADIEEFCDGFNEINDEFANSNSDPLADQDALREAVRMLRDLEPPDEIADDYATVIDGFERLSKVDLTNAAEVASVQDDLKNEQAFDAVAQFVSEEC